MPRSHYLQPKIERQSDKVKLSRIDKVFFWIHLRKETTPVHLVFGLLCVFLMFGFGLLAGIVMMTAFAIWEYWNDRNLMIKYPSYKPEGDMDFWESFLSFSIGWGILGIFQGRGMVNVGWLTGSLF